MARGVARMGRREELRLKVAPTADADGEKKTKQEKTGERKRLLEPQQSFLWAAAHMCPQNRKRKKKQMNERRKKLNIL